jgi:mono/diheme cytochrome c family protein
MTSISAERSELLHLPRKGETMKLWTFAALALALAIAGCNKSEASTNGTSTTTTTSTQTAHATAAPTEDLFKTRCAPCHGESGHGDGPGAAALNPKPRNYTDVAWQTKVSDEDIKKTILYGGAAVGKSPQMPANPDLDGKPELDELVKTVRAFKGK